MTPEQSRAARGWLGWSQAELASRARVSLRTLQAFEKGEKIPIANNLAAIRGALEAAGVSLVFDQEGNATGIAFVARTRGVSSAGPGA
jgi:transcriptional regulator with XRE-family HTH domain